MQKSEIINKAQSCFIGGEGEPFNCAQSVAEACKEIFNLPLNISESYSDLGGGKAPEGYCGSLYAAITILNMTDKSDKVESVKKYFLDNAGSVLCKEIRLNKKMSCLDCVTQSVECLLEIK